MLWSFWLVAAIVLFLIEILTPGTFFFACLGIGAAAAGLAAFLSSLSWLPWIVFAVVALLSIYTLRPIARKFFQHEDHRTNVDALIGQKAFVSEVIAPPSLGLVKVEGEIWRAEAAEKIDTGTAVEVVAIKGTRLEVRKISA